MSCLMKRWWALAGVVLIAAGCTPGPAAVPTPFRIVVTATPDIPASEPRAAATDSLTSTPMATANTVFLPTGNVANDPSFASYCPAIQQRSDWVFTLDYGRSGFECEHHPAHVKGEGAGRIDGYDAPYHVYLAEHLDYGAPGAVVRFTLDLFTWEPEVAEVGRPSQTQRPEEWPQVRIGIGALGESNPSADTIIWSQWYSWPLKGFPWNYTYTAEDVYQAMGVNAVLQIEGRIYYFVEVRSTGQGWPRSDVFLTNARIEFTGYLGSKQVQWFDLSK